VTKRLLYNPDKCSHPGAPAIPHGLYGGVSGDGGGDAGNCSTVGDCCVGGLGGVSVGMVPVQSFGPPGVVS
jgi:hypothetical protein